MRTQNLTQRLFHATPHGAATHWLRRLADLVRTPRHPDPLPLSDHLRRDLGLPPAAPWPTHSPSSCLGLW